MPDVLEDLGLRLAWLIVAVNLAGTAFGFWYYRFQFALEPIAAWPVVPDSPVATLFIALSIASWKLGKSREWLNMLAFFGCLQLGFWTPVHPPRVPRLLPREHPALALSVPLL